MSGSQLPYAWGSTSREKHLPSKAKLALWNPFTLKFCDNKLEATYHSESLVHRPVLEIYAFFFGVIVGICPLEGNEGWLRIWWWGICFIQSPFLGFLIFWKKDFYLKWRTHITVFAMLSSMVYHFLREANLPMPGPTLVDILVRVSKSPVLTFPAAAVFYPLPFRYTFLYTVPCLLGCIYEAYAFCALCSSNPDMYTPVFNVLHRFNWNTVSILSLNSLGVVFPPKTDCKSTMVFMLVLGGVLTPAYIVYRAEVGFRASFLSARVQDRHKPRIQAFEHECRFWSTWVVFGLIILTYILF